MYFAYCRYFDALLCVNSFSFLSGLAFQFFLFSIHYIVYLFFYNHSLSRSISLYLRSQYSTLHPAILYATSRTTLRYIPHDSMQHSARLYAILHATSRNTLRATLCNIPCDSMRHSARHSAQLYATFRATSRATLYMCGWVLKKILGFLYTTIFTFFILFDYGFALHSTLHSTLHSILLRMTLRYTEECDTSYGAPYDTIAYSPFFISYRPITAAHFLFDTTSSALYTFPFLSI